MYDSDAMQKQRDEFDAVANLSKAYKAITYTPVVDDDYSEIRHTYDSALNALIRALKANNRIT